ncbi:MAG TPA: hypothetical protein ENG50_05110 [Candidatus Altiarchaeales archaeon]|nr:MAG: hypothetical protein DRO65_00455 [Candidatus Altiarchaeales archaeon]HDN83724.1 hypothetical protein [Candidatus Altiarchaeales archaeon]
MELITVLIAVVGMIFIILIPGFLLSLAIFPKESDLDSLARLGISAALGFTPQFLLYFADKNLFMRIDSIATYLTILFVALLSLVVWYYRKTRES